MEQKSSNSSSSSQATSSRWNPTREQIAILESLYRQGIRTPTTEQIQQITARLRDFGLAEGKNVFYWFQNHKARQRQKLKQEMIFAHSYNRMLSPGPMPVPVAAQGHGAQPPVTGLHHPQGCYSTANVVCGPYCSPVPQSGVAYHPNVFMQGAMHMNPIPNQPLMPQPYTADQQQQQQQQLGNNLHESYNNNVHGSSSSHSPETLELFPLHPTGILEAERSSGSSLITSASTESDDCMGEGGEAGGENSKPPRYFDFFG